MSLAAAVDIRRWLNRDRGTPFAERLQRDRDIGRRLAHATPGDRVLGWWSEVRRQAPPEALVGARVEALRRYASVLLAFIGSVLGMGLASAAFGYQGQYPVNLFTLLGVLVALPMLMLLLTLVLLLPLPWLQGVQGVLAGMNLGRWVGVWMDRVLGVELATRFGSGGAAGAFARWQLVVLSQWLALGFFAGVLLVTVVLVSATDLAFGWSSTLDLEARSVHRVLHALALPWADLVPAAVPDLHLVELSRSYRLEENRPLAQLERLGDWWPFLVMCVLVYGALPRLLLLGFALWRRRRATCGLLLEDPEVTALLDRLDSSLVATRGEPETESGPATEAPLHGPSAHELGDGEVALVIWNDAAEPTQVRAWVGEALGVQTPPALQLSVLQGEAEQRRRLAALAAPRRVIVVTKGWEPPLLEFVDFLGLLRELAGAACSLTVVPLALDGASVRAGDRAVWAQALARVHDPRLYVLEATA
ncbi:MAG: DUF2868 domain-containing protein [Pseudomonadales bacterium]